MTVSLRYTSSPLAVSEAKLLAEFGERLRLARLRRRLTAVVVARRTKATAADIELTASAFAAVDDVFFDA